MWRFNFESNVSNKRLRSNKQYNFSDYVGISNNFQPNRIAISSSVEQNLNGFHFKRIIELCLCWLSACGYIRNCCLVCIMYYGRGDLCIITMLQLFRSSHMCSFKTTMETAEFLFPLSWEMVSISAEPFLPICTLPLNHNVGLQSTGLCLLLTARFFYVPNRSCIFQYYARRSTSS